MDRLVQAALVGLSRHASLPLDPDDPADAELEAASRGASHPPESQLLVRAGLHAVYRQAGQIPARVEKRPDPAAMDDSPACSPRLIALLRNVLSDEKRDLLPEFLGLLRNSNLLLPPELLPLALDFTDVVHRELVLPLLGHRGRWLSQFQPGWSWATEGVGQLAAESQQRLHRRWLEGGIQDRCDALHRVRQADPALARQWLEECWSKEKAEHRGRLLKMFSANLTLGDEPFLEACLGDRSEAVRTTAAELLSQLVLSQLSQRMVERGNLAVQGQIAGAKLTLMCHPPEELPADWARDGVPKQAPAGRGKRAVWLETVLSSIRPSHWCERWNASPTSLLEAIEDDPFAEPAVTGWTQAAIRHGEVDPRASDWYGPLWHYWLAVANRTNGQHRQRDLLPELLERMPSDRAETALLEWFRDERGGDLSFKLHSLWRRRAVWSHGFARSWLALAFAKVARSKDNQAYQWSDALAGAARLLPAGVLDEAISGADTLLLDRPTQPAFVERGLQRFREILDLRKSFFAELPTTPGQN